MQPSIVTSQAGLEEWNLIDGVWQEDDVLTAGLNLGVKYPVAGLDPSMDPTTTGLRNLSAPPPLSRPALPARSGRPCGPG